MTKGLFNTAQVDSEVAALLQQFAEVCGKFPGFIGVRNGCVNVKQRLRLSNLSVQSHAAAWAAIYATRVSDFLLFQHRTSIDADGLGEWLRHRELMPLARAVIMFFNMDYLLTSEPLDVGEAIDPTVIPFLKTTLTAWFATAPQQPGETGDDVWQRWAAQIQIDEEVMKKHLRPALDAQEFAYDLVCGFQRKCLLGPNPTSRCWKAFAVLVFTVLLILKWGSSLVSFREKKTCCFPPRIASWSRCSACGKPWTLCANILPSCLQRSVRVCSVLFPFCGRLLLTINAWFACVYFCLLTWL